MKVVSRGRAALLTVIAVAVLVALGVVVGVLARTHHADDTVEANRDELRAQAGRIVADVFSVDTRTWQSDRDRARGLVGPEFTESYGAQLNRAPTEPVVSVVWRPETVGLVRVGEGDGEVLIRVEVTTRTQAAPDPAPTRQTVLTHFVKHADHWLLDRADIVG
ncbi:hypothetical protein [Gordonia sp. NPDC003585]|uniref:hypothetical protein n=1 Tax=Gordonia sp. NPDC003585 TaxID=3154275 RepID=UPI0033B92A48